MTSKRTFLALLVSAFAGLGCTAGKSPFLEVQLCLENEQGVADFKAVLESIAKSDGLNFVDFSREFKETLVRQSKYTHNAIQPDPIFHFRLELGDYIPLIADNFGRPGYQVGIGFSDVKQAPAAHALADKTIGALSTHWKVERVPQGKEARPLKGCPAKPDEIR